MFWLHEEELPAGVGMAPFGAAHLAYLALFSALAVGYAFFYQRLGARGRELAGRALGAAILLLWLFETAVTALRGRLSLGGLPLHLCSLMLFAASLHAWTGRARPGSFAARLRSFLGALLFFPGLPGALAALLFPDWLRYPLFNYMSLTGFFEHGLLLTYGASVVAAIAEAPEPRRLFRRDLCASLLFLGLGAPAIAFFDRATGTNYWFLSGPSADSPFLAAWRRGGYGGYLLVFALTAAAVAALCYALRYLLFVRGREETRREGGTQP